MQNENKVEVVVLAEFEAAAVADDLLSLVTVERTPSDPGRIAQEAEARAAFLRSRPLTEAPELRRLERRVLWELDTLAEEARAFVTAEARGTILGPQAAAERAEIDRLAFAGFRRYEQLVTSLDPRYPTRVRPPDAKKRAEELAAIDRFLATRGAGGTGTEGR